MQSIEGFDFFGLSFDKDGALESASELEGLKNHLATTPVTDVVFIAHGFRNSERDAIDLYTKFLGTLRVHLKAPEFQASLGSRRFAVAGVFWPSQQFPEKPGASTSDGPRGGLQDGSSQSTGSDLLAAERAREQLQELRDRYATPAQKPEIDKAIALLPSVEGNTVTQDQFVALVLSLFDGTADDPTEGGQRVRTRPGSELLDRLGAPVILPTTADDDEGGVTSVTDFAPGGDDGDGGVQGVGGFFNSVLGQVNQLLNFTTWYLVKDRGGKVGSTGVPAAVRAVAAAAPKARLHLVGHSLGGRLMAACAKTLCTPPALRVDSLSLLEAAFSHYGFSPDNGKGTAGFFRNVIAQQIVKGPVIATYSMQDAVVGYAYAIASRLAGDNAKAIGDANDEFGGLGRNGTQKTSEAVQDVLHAAGRAYQFKTGVVSNLDGSGGLIKDHSDITNTTVTYAVASALART